MIKCLKSITRIFQLTATVLIIFIQFSFVSKAQESDLNNENQFNQEISEPVQNISLGVGLHTTKLTADDPGSWLMYKTDTTDYHSGGSFDGAQAGVDIRITSTVDSEGKYRILLGFIYTPFIARERLPIARGATLYLKHSLDVKTIYAGFQYAFVKFPKAKAKGYGGIDVCITNISRTEFSRRIEYPLIPINNYELTSHIKPDAWRGGLAFKLGFEGDLYNNVQLNVNAGPSIMNLFGRNNGRRELLTPKTFLENKESVVVTFNVSLLLQFRL